jgi:CheY-like chemotaxis protein
MAALLFLPQPGSPGTRQWLGCYHAMSRRVLVVDDDPLMLDVTAAMLEDLGCDVVTADAGPTALEKLAADERIEVLITDINMPGMTVTS